MSAPQPEQLGQWFDQYAAQLVLYARQWLARQAAEDVVQEVFVRLAAGAAPLSIKPWLFRAVRNQAISALRHQQRRQHREETLAADRPAWFESGVDDLVDAQMAQTALAELPPELREMVILRIWGAMTLAEVGQVTGLPISTVHDQYRTALRRLREKMESSCVKKNL